MEFKQRVLESLAISAAAVLFGSTAFGEPERTTLSAAPLPSHSAAPTAPSRTWEQAAPVSRIGAEADYLPVPLNNNTTNSTVQPTSTNTGSGDNFPPGRQDFNPQDTRDNSTVDEGEPPSQTSSDSAATPPGQPNTFPPIGGVAGGGAGGGGQTPQPPQFQQIPAAGVAQMGTPPQEANLTGALTAATDRLSKTLDGSALTAMTDKIGQDMAKFQESLFGIINTNTAAIRQGMANASAMSMANLPQNSQGVSGAVGAATTMADTGPRTGQTSQRSGGAGGSTGGPRASEPTFPQSSNDQLADRTPASPQQSGGQRGRLDGSL